MDNHDNAAHALYVAALAMIVLAYLLPCRRPPSPPAPPPVPRHHRRDKLSARLTVMARLEYLRDKERRDRQS